MIEGERVEMQKKTEASLPVSARVDVRRIAEMVVYFESEGLYIKSMSQIVNWSVDLCCQILKMNDKMPESIDNMLKAINVLEIRHLCQKSMKSRGLNKIIRGRQLENLRFEGVDPSTGGAEGRKEYDIAHKSNAVEPAPNATYVSKVDRSELYAETKRKIEEEDRAAAKAQINELEVDEDGMVIVETHGRGDYTAEDKAKDERERERQKAAELMKECEKIAKPECSEKRPLTEEELREKLKEREEKDREQLEAFKNM